MFRCLAPCASAPTRVHVKCSHETWVSADRRQKIRFPADVQVIIHKEGIRTTRGDGLVCVTPIWRRPVKAKLLVQDGVLLRKRDFVPRFIH